MIPRKDSVTLEDLLKVKRAERPPQEFWAQFEREMRAKELAAIVEPRPWWAPFIRIGARVSRHQLPVGAAAILALSVVTVRQYQSSDLATGMVPEAAMAAVPAQMAATTVEAPMAATLESPRPLASQLPSEAAGMQSAELPASAQTGQRSHAVALLDTSAPPREPTPSARYIAANLAAVQADEPRIVDDVFGSPVRSAEERSPVRDPLSRIGTTSEARRARLLTTALPVAAAAVAVGTSDRVARRLTEDRLYDSISRVGVRGDRVAIKF